MLNLLALLISLPAAHSTELKNDSCRCDGTEESVTFQTGFVDGECWASVYEPSPSDYPFTPEYVTVLAGPSGEAIFGMYLYNVDSNNKPTSMVGGEGFALAGSENALSTLRFDEAEVVLDPITEGNIAIVMCFDGHSSNPTIANDTNGTSQENLNWIQAGGQWATAKSFGVNGDWIMRVGWGEGDADTDTDSDSDTDVDTDTDSDTDVGELDLYAITPASTKEGTAVDVLISGEGFVQGAQVHIGGIALTGTTVQDDGQITGRSPTALPAGVHDVDVVNPDGTSSYLAGAFTVEGGCGCSSGAAGTTIGMAWLFGVAALLRRRGAAPR